MFLSCVMSFLHSEYFPFPLPCSLFPYPTFQILLLQDLQFEAVTLPIFSLAGCWGTYVPMSMAEPLNHLGLCDLAKWVSVLKLPLPIHLSFSATLKIHALE